MYCHACGAEIMDGAAFCSSCGAKQGFVPQPQQQVASADEAVGPDQLQAVADTYEQAYSEPALPEGQELLSGLLVAQDYLQVIADKMASFLNNEGQIKSNRDVMATKPMAHLKPIADVGSHSVEDDRWLTIAMACSCLGFNLILAAIAVYAYAKRKLNVLRVVSALGLAWFVYTVAIYRGVLMMVVLEVLLGLMGCAAGRVAARIVKKNAKESLEGKAGDVAAQNRSIVESNRQIDEQNAQLALRKQVMAKENERLAAANRALALEAQQLTSELTDEVGHWYPWGSNGEYYALDVVAAFVSIVRNHEADTVKEMMQVYKQDRYRVAVLNNQDQISGQINQALQNQRTMIGNQRSMLGKQDQMISLQRKANAIAMANCMANMATASNTTAMKNDLGAIKNDVSDIKNSAAATAANSAATAANSAVAAANSASAAKSAGTAAYNSGHWR